MSETLPDEISVDGVTLVLSVERKRVKRVNARLRGSMLYISAPPEMDHRQLEPAIEELARRLLRRVHALELNREEALKLSRKVARRSRATTGCRASFVRHQSAVSLGQLQHEDTYHKAQRCSPQYAGGWVLEAVVAHELTHVIHPDHSPAFWKLLRGVCPDTDRANAFLEGVGWLGHNWENLPPVQRTLLTRR